MFYSPCTPYHFYPYLNKPLCGNSDLDLDTSLDVDDNLLDDLGGGVQVDEALVDAHLVGVPGLGTLTARGLTGGDLEVLGGKADGTLDAELLGFGTVDELLANLCDGSLMLVLPRRVKARSPGVNILSRDLTLRLVRVIRILWILGPSPKSFSGLSVNCQIYARLCNMH
jgi:hypothetical protein